jgi:hypothetical protein
MNKPVYTYTLLIGVVIALMSLLAGASSYHLPDNQQDYQPTQPIAFSHHLHAGELSIDCQYCHSGAETSRHAGIPAANVCMNCHQVVTSSWGAVLAEDKRIEELKKQAAKENLELSPEETTPKLTISDELGKLYDALALNDERQRDSAKSSKLIEWVKVHNLPDYVYFDHRAHVHAGVDCQTCHGNTESMERVRQAESLSMGWCVNCHRESNRIGVKGKTVDASLDCTTCHY